MQDPPDDCHLWRTSHIIHGPCTLHISFLSLRTPSVTSETPVSEMKLKIPHCWLKKQPGSKPRPAGLSAVSGCLVIKECVFTTHTNKRAALPSRPPGGFQSGATAGRLKLPEQGVKRHSHWSGNPRANVQAAGCPQAEFTPRSVQSVSGRERAGSSKYKDGVREEQTVRRL